jgi:hypothetical protein
MKMVKSLLLGTAAGLVALTGAQAADLPVKAKPVQYVKICSLYGAGFYYIPGTDTCIKIGGFVRAEMNFNANTSFAEFNRVNFDSRGTNFTNTRARFAISADARTQTEYGTLRSYLIIAEQIDTGTPTSNPQGIGGSDVRAWSNAGFIQLAGFTAGATTSFFDFDTFSYSNQTNVLGSSWAGAGIPVFAYTAQFGNGLSASISAEGGGGEGRRSHILAFNPGITNSSAGYAGREIPDFVANLRIDQAWGSAQIMGAVHDVRPQSYDLSGFGDAPDDKVGWAAGAGVKLNLPFFGSKDYVITQFTYTEGALAYVGSGLAGIAGAGATPAYLIQTGTPGSNLQSAYGPVFDATYGGPGTDLDLTKAWSVTAGFEHWWLANVRTSLYGAFAQFRYSDTSSARLAASGTGGAAGVAGGTGSADWQLWQVGSRTVWSPVQNLDLSVEVMYQGVETAFGNGSCNVAGTSCFDNKQWLSGMFRVQRNFYP